MKDMKIPIPSTENEQIASSPFYLFSTFLSILQRDKNKPANE